MKHVGHEEFMEGVEIEAEPELTYRFREIKATCQRTQDLTGLISPRVLELAIEIQAALDPMQGRGILLEFVGRILLELRPKMMREFLRPGGPSIYEQEVLDPRMRRLVEEEEAKLEGEAARMGVDLRAGDPSAEECEDAADAFRRGFPLPDGFTTDAPEIEREEGDDDDDDDWLRRITLIVLKGSARTMKRAELRECIEELERVGDDELEEFGEGMGTELLELFRAERARADAWHKGGKL